MNLPTEDAPEGFSHAWYSIGQAVKAGTSYYRNQEGKDIEISEVKTSKEPSYWTDAKYLGLVTEWVRQGIHGERP